MTCYVISCTYGEPMLYWYFSVAVWWGVFATNIQCKFYPKSSTSRYILVFILNLVFCPFAMALANFRMISGKHDKYFTQQSLQLDPKCLETGLLADEQACLDRVVASWNSFVNLERQHPDELRDFANAVHAQQGLLATRIARRDYPDGWPTYFDT